MGDGPINGFNHRPAGWRLRCWLVVGATLLVAAGLFYLQWRGRALRIDRQVGIYLNTDKKGVFIDDVFPDLPAKRSGIQPGDRLVGMDGTPIRKYEDYDAVARGFQRGRPVTFLVERAGSRLVIQVRPGGEFPWVPFILNIVTAIAYLALGFIVCFQPTHDLRKRLLFLFSIAIAFELALPTEFLDSLILEIVFLLAFYLLSAFQFAVDLHLVSFIPEIHPWLRGRSWIIRMYYVFALGISAVLAAAYLAGALDWQWFPWPSLSATFVLNNVLLPVWVVAVLLLIGTQAVRHPEPLGRHQAGLVLLGVLPWMAMVAVTGVFQLSAFVSGDTVDALWALALFPFPVAIFTAMYRYQLLDIQLVVRKGLIFSALTGTLLVIFYAVLGAGSFLLSEAMLGTINSAWLVAGVALLLGLGFPPLQRAFQHWIDRRFFPERLAFRQRLTALAGALPAHGKVPRMGQHLVDELRSIFELRSAMLLLVDASTGFLTPLASTFGQQRAPDASAEALLDWKDLGVRLLIRNRKSMPTERLLPTRSNLAKYLLLFDVEWVVPLMAQDRLSGILFIGRKTGGRRFRAEEIELLDFLAQHVAIVFENAKLYESATYDSLTGILRREAVFEKLDQEIRRAVRYGRPLTVGMADLDHFKEVNDRYGHLAGDMTLRRVAQILSETLRGADLVGRYGGEEFLLVFPETDPRNALDVAERIRRLVAGLEYRTPDGQPFRVSISIGLAALSERIGDDPALRETLIESADQALRSAKRGGRNRVQLEAAAGAEATGTISPKV